MPSSSRNHDLVLSCPVFLYFRRRGFLLAGFAFAFILALQFRWNFLFNNFRCALCGVYCCIVLVGFFSFLSYFRRCLTYVCALQRWWYLLGSSRYKVVSIVAVPYRALRYHIRSVRCDLDSSAHVDKQPCMLSWDGCCFCWNSSEGD